MRLSAEGRRRVPQALAAYRAWALAYRAKDEAALRAPRFGSMPCAELQRLTGSAWEDQAIVELAARRVAEASCGDDKACLAQARVEVLRAVVDGFGDPEWARRAGLGSGYAERAVVRRLAEAMEAYL